MKGIEQEYHYGKEGAQKNGHATAVGGGALVGFMTSLGGMVHQAKTPGQALYIRYRERGEEQRPQCQESQCEYIIHSRMTCGADE